MQQGMKNGTLGERIRAQLEYFEQHPLEAARLAASSAGEKDAARFDTVEAMFERVKAAITADVEAGIFPKPVTLTRAEELALETFNWYSLPDKRMTKFHACYQLQVAFDDWARAEEIRWTFHEDYDSGGETRGWDLRVLKPTQAPTRGAGRTR